MSSTEKKYACSVCGREFDSWRALGGYVDLGEICGRFGAHRLACACARACACACVFVCVCACVRLGWGVGSCRGNLSSAMAERVHRVGKL